MGICFSFLLQEEGSPSSMEGLDLPAWTVWGKRFVWVLLRTSDRGFL